MSLLKVDSSGTIILVTPEDVTEEARESLSKEISDQNTAQTTQLTSKIDTDIQQLETSTNQRTGVIETRIQTLKTQNNNLKERLDDLDTFVLSEPGAGCPAGYKHVDKIDRCWAATRQLERRGFSGMEPYRQFKDTQWNQFLYGCFMADDSHSRTHFNHSKVARTSAKNEILVCERK